MSSLEEIESNLSLALLPRLERIVDRLKSGDLLIIIPDEKDIEQDVSQLHSLVARTSNAYEEAAVMAGAARAQAKLAKAAFERAYKTSRHDTNLKNQTARDAKAMEAAADEHHQCAIAESLAEVAEGIEAAARVASESARKLLTSVLTQMTASNRGASGFHNPDEFKTY